MRSRSITLLSMGLAACGSLNAALAAPPAAVLDVIAHSYRPDVTASAGPEASIRTSVAGGGCRAREVELTAADPITGEARGIQVKLYRPGRMPMNGEAALRTIIVMPPTGGVTKLDLGYADDFCSAGFRVALVRSWKYDTVAELDMDMHDRGALRALTAIRHVVEWLHPVRPAQVGILGTSVGAIASALAAGFEPRISALATIVGGGGMSEVIGLSHEQTLSRLREARMKTLSLAAPADYVLALRPHIQWDPLDFAGFSGPKPVWSMIATRDATVPTQNQFALYRAWGSQDLLTHDDDHVPTVVYTFVVRRAAVRHFFERVLK